MATRIGAALALLGAVALWGCSESATNGGAAGSAGSDGSAADAGGAGGTGGATGGFTSSGGSGGSSLTGGTGGLGPTDAGADVGPPDPWPPGDCGDGGVPADAQPASVAGKWCGKPNSPQCLGDEAFYLDIQQAGEVVTGQACENPGKDCLPVRCGRVLGSQLTFFYAFFEKQNWERVDVTVALNGSGQLVGSLFATKCNCTIPLTLHAL